MLQETFRTKQFGIPAVGSQHRWTRRAAESGMPEFSNNSFSGGCASNLGAEPKQGYLGNLKLSDCIENKD